MLTAQRLLTDLTATLDALEHAARSQQDMSAAMAAATLAMVQIEQALPTLSATDAATLTIQRDKLLTRLNAIADQLSNARDTLGAKLHAARARAKAAASYGGSK